MIDKTGLIHIYYGNGKGKTTTGMGLITRAAGYGYRVLLYQFMKNNNQTEDQNCDNNLHAKTFPHLPAMCSYAAASVSRISSTVGLAIKSAASIHDSIISGIC